ncbi:MAG: efflux RND transporter periplasmic adaptor subunit [Bacteroidales bacterium]|nr:efflux RND transporter periplasmic adaptor subunit [Bacteroidales bacterium]
MKKLIYLALIIFLAACGSKVDEPSTDEEILSKISEYKQQMSEMNNKIIELEQQLSSSLSDDNAIAVTTKKMDYQPFKHYIEVSGVVEALHEAYISPEINGQVMEIYVVEGQRVKKGDLLVKINSSITESTIKEVETNLELAKTVYKKQQELWDKNIGSEIDYLQAKNNVESLENKLETLSAQLDLAEIKAPFDGIVDDIIIKKGEMAAPGTQIIQLVNLQELYVNADVSESYISSVKVGEQVVLEFPSYPEIHMEVPVYRTGNIIKSANRTFKVQLKIKNEKEKLKPNLLAKIKINDYTNDHALLVPSIIIKEDRQGSYLYVVNPKDRTAKKTYVETGRSYHDETVVSSGISEGDIVIVEGYSQVSNGSKVKITG